MSNYEFELRLIGSGAPDGEVSLAILARLAEGLQELNLRIGRDLLESPGPGRSGDLVSALTEMRLSSVTKGSTRINFVRGPHSELDLDLPEAARLEARFWEIIAALGENFRPDWTTDLVADSARKLVAALKGAASEVVFTRPNEKPLTMQTSALVAEVWVGEAAEKQVPETVVTGRLEAVDLRSGRFRVLDDVGNRIPLDHVHEPESVAHLINQRVHAVGSGIFVGGGHLRGLHSAVVEQQSLPGSWSTRTPIDLASELAKPGPTLGGGVDLTDEEFDEFMATIKGS